MKKKLLTISLCACLALSSCGNVNRKPENVNKLSYVRKDIPTVTAVKSDIVPKKTLKLSQDGLKYIEYSVTENNLDLEKLYVKVGDVVKKGDLLVSFKAETLEGKINEYKTRIEENKLLIDHYKNLKKIEKNDSYDRDITLLERDIIVAELYLEEYNEQYEKCQIRATEDGKILAVSEELQMGFCYRTNNIITETSGTGKYSAAVFDNYDYKVDKKYTAQASGINFTFTLIRVDEFEDSDKRMLIFEPESDMSALSEKDMLTMIIEQDVIKDVITVPNKSILVDDNGKYVLVEKDNGYFERIKVEVGERVGDDVIILSGLKGGEKVKK